jgi:hypothetical protein
MALFGTGKVVHFGTNEDLFTLRLRNVRDYADVHSLWSSAHGGNKDIVESGTNKSDQRLRNALDMYRGHFKQAHTLGFKAAAKVFTDVLIWIPELVWRRALKYGGDIISLLSANLAALHLEDLGAETIPDKSPACLVMPEDLPEGEIVFQFGRGVYVPRSGDAPMAWVQLKGEEQQDWVGLPEWVRFDNNRLVPLHPGIYPGQSGLLVGCTLDSAPVRIPESGLPEWFARGEGAVFLNYDLRHSLNGAEFIFGDEQRMSQPEVVFADQQTGEVVFRFYRCVQRTLDERSEPLLVRVVPGAKPPVGRQPRVAGHVASGSGMRDGRSSAPSSASVFRNPAEPSPARPSPAEPSPGGPSAAPFDLPLDQNEAVSQRPEPSKGPIQPVTQPVLDLVLNGLALPRLDPPLAEFVTRWRLGIDADGKLLASASSKGEPTLVLSSLAVEGKLRAQRVGDIRHQLIQDFPWTYAFPKGVTATIAEPHDPSLYLGLLRSVPFGLTIPVDDTVILGRETEAERSPEGFFALNVVSNPNTLRFRSGKEQPSWSLGGLRLSEGHLEITAQGRTLNVRHLSHAWPSYVLRPTGESIRLDHGQVATAEVSPGDRLIVGVYLLTIQARG